jgi:hypothetical protein
MMLRIYPKKSNRITFSYRITSGTRMTIREKNLDLPRQRPHS